MKKQQYDCVITAFLIWCMCTCSLGEDSNTLQSLPWKIGDSWKVRSWRSTGGLIMANSKNNEDKPLKLDKEKPFIINFEVSAIKSLDDFNIPYKPLKIPERVKYNRLVGIGKIKKDEIKCFEVQVTFPEEMAGFQERYLLYFRKDTSNLIRVLNVSKRSDGTIINSTTDYPLNPDGAIITVDVPCSIPFDWPNWKKSNISIDDKKNNEKDVQQIKKNTFTDKNGKSFDGFEINLGIKMKNGDKEKDIINSVQKWKKGALWWSEIKRYNENGSIAAEAELVDSNEIIKDKKAE